LPILRGLLAEDGSKHITSTNCFRIVKRSLVLPAGLGAGLSQVVQVIGPRYLEDLCLDAVEALEEGGAFLTPIDPR
jgi:hypothetical protein